MSEGDNKKKSPFSIYWVYAIIGVALIAFQLFSSSSGRITLQYQSTFDQLAVQGYLTDVKLINKVRVDFKINNEGKKFIKASKDAKFKVIKEAFSKGSNIVRPLGKISI